MPSTSAVAPRCLDRNQAALYLSVSTRQVDRMIQTGTLPVIKLPVERARTSSDGRLGMNRRILIDVKDLDTIIDRSKVRDGP
jgi:hypothetical protein